MRIRILKHLISVYGSMEPGAVHEIPENTAESWCHAGIAMQEKSQDGGKETKAEPQLRKTASVRRKRKTKK